MSRGQLGSNVYTIVAVTKQIPTCTLPKPSPKTSFYKTGITRDTNLCTLCIWFKILYIYWPKPCTVRRLFLPHLRGSNSVQVHALGKKENPKAKIQDHHHSHFHIDQSSCQCHETTLMSKYRRHLSYYYMQSTNMSL